MDQSLINRELLSRQGNQSRSGYSVNEQAGSVGTLEDAEEKVVELVKIALDAVESIKVMNGYVVQTVSDDHDRDNGNGNVSTPAEQSMDIDNKIEQNENVSGNNAMITQEQSRHASDSLIRLSKDFSEKIQQLKSTLVDEVNNQAKSIGSSSKGGAFSYQLSSYTSRIQASVAKADLDRLKSEIKNALKE